MKVLSLAFFIFHTSVAWSQVDFNKYGQRIIQKIEKKLLKKLKTQRIKISSMEKRLSKDALDLQIPQRRFSDLPQDYDSIIVEYEIITQKGSRLFLSYGLQASYNTYEKKLFDREGNQVLKRQYTVDVRIGASGKTCLYCPRTLNLKNLQTGVTVVTIDPNIFNYRQSLYFYRGENNEKN